MAKIKWLHLLTAMLAPYRVQGAAVFSHFMVGNTEYFAQSDWETNMQTAMDYHIDAFALNMAHGWVDNAKQVSLAFAAADSVGFKLFYSFDYAGNGPWPKADVIQFIQDHASDGSYYHYNGQPFVSTFEGPDSSNDWVDIKSQTGCFFVPDWSSIGAGPALAKGVADGLFSWAAWRWGNWPLNTYTDAAYNTSLNGLPYMMPVSPWFYTNLPGYDKNWLWSSDDLWFDRWQEVWSFQPEWVEVITWNDWGESHYIGPLDDKQYDLFNETNGKAPFNYVDKMPHDAWGLSLPFLIDTYKNGIGTIISENIYVWHRLSPATACKNDFTKGNSASQLQIEFLPWDIVNDRVYFSALLAVDASFTVTIGGKGAEKTSMDWTSMPDSGVGLFHGSVPFNGLTGEVEVCLSRQEIGNVLCVTGGTIASDCSSTNGYTNWNAFTAFKAGPEIGGDPTQPTLKLSEQKCIKGFGTNDFNTICVFVCALGYCPPAACTCSQMGAPPKVPDATGHTGYSKNGMIEFQGLCAYACLYGFCGFKNNTVCVDSPTTLSIPAVSPFNPPACTGGSGEGDFSDLCKWSCQYGYCPISSCTCDSQGDLADPPAQVGDITAAFTPVKDVMAYDDLCQFACSRGHCPDVCASNLICTSGSGTDSYDELCGYTCKYGFCPDPCTCLSNGTQVTPPSIVPGVTGYGAIGLDSKTYDPLCNFTCTHGYCPDDDCLYEEVDAASSISSPSADDLVPFQSGTTYSAGDGFLYDTPMPSDITLDVTLVGAPTVWEDADCRSIYGEYAPGVDGDTIGCIAAAVAFVETSILQNANQISTSRTRSLSSNYHFQPHSDWERVDNCSTRCMLLNGTPLNTWTSVGNGTYNGIYHELHFIHTDKVIGHRASQGGSTNTSRLTSRFDGNYASADSLAVIIYATNDAEAGMRRAFESENGGVDLMADSMSHTVAVSNFSEFCCTFYDGDKVASITVIKIIQDGKTVTWEPSAANAAETLTNICSNGTLGNILLNCEPSLSTIDPSLLDDPDGNTTSYVYPVLNPRGETSGSKEDYAIFNVYDPEEVVTFTSANYPNGNDGQDLQTFGGDTHVYRIANGNCTDPSIVGNAPLGANLQAEHVVERQTIPFFMQYIQDPYVDLEDGNGPVSANGFTTGIPFSVIRNYMTIPYNQWEVVEGDLGTQTPTGTFFQDLADALGASVVNPAVMTNLEDTLNGMKSRIWNTFTDPTEQANWNDLANNPTIANTQAALNLIRQGMAIFNYLNDNNVQRLLGDVHEGIRSAANQFDLIYNTHATHYDPQVISTNIEGMWRSFINLWAQRIENRFNNYLTAGVNGHAARFTQLRAGWNNILNNNPTPQQTREATQALQAINALFNQVGGTVTFNRAAFP